MYCDGWYVLRETVPERNGAYVCTLLMRQSVAPECMRRNAAGTTAAFYIGHLRDSKYSQSQVLREVYPGLWVLECT